MATLSITIIGHNEADHLRELLPRLSWADEVVYVDCESEDDSLAVVESHGSRVFSRPNNRNLNVNKSFGIEQTSSDWVFYLDPDERLPEALVAELCKIKDSDTPHAAFQLNRRNHYFGHWLRHGSQYPDTQLRFFRKGKAQFPNRHVHEKLEISGSIGKLHNDMLHHPYLTISQFLRKFDFYTDVEADYLMEAGVRPGPGSHLWFLVLLPWTRFWRRYLLKGGFRDGLPGLFCALFDALNVIVRYCKLWERIRNPPT